MVDIANDTQSQQYWNQQAQIAQTAYNQALLQGDSEKLAFQKAQQAMTDAMNYSGAYGYAPGGNWTTWGPGGPVQPPAGTPTMQAINQQQSLYGQQLQNQLGIAGVTGYYAAPTNAYNPGQIVTDGQGGYGIIQADGSAKILTPDVAQTLAAQRGVDASSVYSNALNIGGQQLQRLFAGPPTATQQMTTAYQKQLADQAAQAAGLTGLYNDPTQTLEAYNARGQAINGQTFQSLPQDQQQFWLQYNQNDPNAAAQAWARGTNAALQGAGVQPQGQTQATLQMQQLYGQYGAPTAGQQTMAMQQQNYQQWLDAQKQALSQWQAQQGAAQNYLTLLSNLRGPADYMQYQKVLGATPGGMQDLVRAAAGQYIPGAGATTGVQPQAVTLQSFVNSATGGAQNQQSASDQAAMNSLVAPNQMAPQTWNALTPSQQQMLLGTWESQGYTQDDAKALFQQSLPKYATQSAGAGSFRLQ